MRKVCTEPGAAQQNIVPIDAMLHLYENSEREDIEQYMEAMFR